MDIKVLGIDLGKTFCSLAGRDEAGAVVFHKRLLPGFEELLRPAVVSSLRSLHSNLHPSEHWIVVE